MANHAAGLHNRQPRLIRALLKERVGGCDRAPSRSVLARELPLPGQYYRKNGVWGGDAE